jgi:choline dehydrogenase-like flavoprotein
MAHIRGHWAVYDAWEAGGAAGWGYDSLLPYFKRSEDATGRDPVLLAVSTPFGPTFYFDLAPLGSGGVRGVLL